MSHLTAPRRRGFFAHLAVAMWLGVWGGPDMRAVWGALPPITWGSAQTVTGDSDVDTSGTLLYAYTFGSSGVSGTTVNGVAFSPFAVAPSAPQTVTVGNVTLTESPGRLFGSNLLGSVSGSFGALSSSYRSLLGSGVYADSPFTITVLLSGLTNGQQYRLQWWTNDATNSFLFSNTTATAVNSVTLDANTSNAAGGVGQYAIGTFTASGTSQQFLLAETSGGINPLINALQVRAVPEPSTYALALGGLACGGWRVRRRRKTRFQSERHHSKQ